MQVVPFHQIEPTKIENKRDELNFENIVTAELYKVNLNGTKSLF
jgi:hypothetical protein